MASKHVLKICNIIEFFEDDNKMIKRGENALESNHVKSMQFDADLLLIRGDIHASMKDKIYNVQVGLLLFIHFIDYLSYDLFILQITLSKSGEITSATCTCPRGIKCHHIATLALFGHYNISVTDKECQWNAPKQKNLPIKTAEEMYPPKPYVAIEDPVTEQHKNKLKGKLTQFGNTVGFTWLLQHEVSDEDIKDLPVIENIISSDDFIGASNKIEMFKQQCQLSDEQIKDIAAITIDQTANEKWFLIRKFRLTASNFGLILGACKRNRYPESIFKTLLGKLLRIPVYFILWGFVLTSAMAHYIFLWD